GKTTTAINLATVMSQSSRRVILIEADMRRPRLYRAFGVEPATGLSEVLIEHATLEQAILETEIDGLDLLPCGPIPPNPAELFHTQRFLDVLEELKKRYERVIIDSPPVIAVTDAMILAQLVDGVILVSKAGSTRRELLKRSKELLEGIGANLIGTILNNVNFENRRYGKYYYYYRRYGQYYDHSTDRP
ncbi:MAG: capsular biosynthesis protein, partial [Deltaproteobacteria bacterium CG17_big_fil_post_rev_8_21_14_2_50_63_7]